MWPARFRNASNVSVFLAVVLTACGRSGLDGFPEDGTGGAGVGIGGLGASGGGGAMPTGGSSSGGSSTSGTSGGPTGGGGTGPDFDFTIEPNQAVAYQIDPEHSGAQFGALPNRRLEPPLRQRWRVEFDGPISYPVAGDNRSFVTEKLAIGSVVHAFDPATGIAFWHSETIEGDAAVHLAYDRRGLFAVSQKGSVVAFSPQNGDVRWRRDILEIQGQGTMPIAAGGVLFFSAYGSNSPTLYALDERNGDVLYSRPTRWGHLTLGGGLLYASNGCHETQAHDPRDGSIAWYHVEECVGAHGDLGVYHDGLLYTGDASVGIVALDATIGEVRSTLDDAFPSGLVSATGDDLFDQSFAAGTYVFNAFEPADGSRRWSVALPGNPTLPLLLTPGYAWALLEDDSVDRYLVAIDLATRELVWQSPEPTIPNDPGWPSNVSGPVQAMAAAESRILVAKRNVLAGFVLPEHRECGNRFVERGEVCDDGNVADGDYCNHDCTEVSGRCGDGVIQSNESCDGASMLPGTSCSDDCQVTFDGVMLAAGNRHTCGLRRDSSVTCWGSTPLPSDVPDAYYMHISAYESLTAGLLVDGSAVFWGRNDVHFPDARSFTKLEVADRAYCAIRTNGLLSCEGLTLPPTGRTYVDLSAANHEVCALTPTGDLDCYFDHEVARWSGKYRAVSVAQDGNTCAIKDDRTLLCHGNLAPPSGEFVAVSGGYGFWCGIRAGGTLACWGNPDARDGSSLEPPEGQFAVLDAGWQHACAVRIDGRTVCWGANDGGQSDAPGDFP
jgi:cysteine-rich repeat protein